MQPQHPGFDPNAQPPQPGYGWTPEAAPAPAPKRSTSLLWPILAGCVVVLVTIAAVGVVLTNRGAHSSPEAEVREAAGRLAAVFADASEGNPDTWIPFTKDHVCKSHQAFFGNAGNWILAESGDAESRKAAQELRAIAADPSQVEVRLEGENKAYATFPPGESSRTETSSEMLFLHEDGEWKVCDE